MSDKEFLESIAGTHDSQPKRKRIPTDTDFALIASELREASKLLIRTDQSDDPELRKLANDAIVKCRKLALEYDLCAVTIDKVDHDKPWLLTLEFGQGVVVPGVSTRYLYYKVKHFAVGEAVRLARLTACMVQF